MGAQVEMAKWVQGHPAFKVKRYHLSVPQRRPAVKQHLSFSVRVRKFDFRALEQQMADWVFSRTLGINKSPIVATRPLVGRHPDLKQTRLLRSPDLVGSFPAPKCRCADEVHKCDVHASYL